MEVHENRRRGAARGFKGRSAYVFDSKELSAAKLERAGQGIQGQIGLHLRGQGTGLKAREGIQGQMGLRLLCGERVGTRAGSA